MKAVSKLKWVAKAPIKTAVDAASTKVPGGVKKRAATAESNRAQGILRQAPPSAEKQLTKAKVEIKAEPVKSPRRPRHENVRGRVLAMLAAGPMSTTAILSAGEFSASGLALNLKALRSEGLVMGQRTGQSVTFSLVGKTHTAAPKAEFSAGSGKVKTPVAKKVTQKPKFASISDPIVAAIVDPSVLEATGRKKREKLSPIENADEKLYVLEVLSQTLPEPIAGLLKAIRNDILKLGSA